MFDVASGGPAVKSAKASSVAIKSGSVFAVLLICILISHTLTTELYVLCKFLELLRIIFLSMHQKSYS